MKQFDVKPCPRCGGMKIAFGFDWAQCESCGYELIGIWNGNQEMAEKNWNEHAKEGDKHGKS